MTLFTYVETGQSSQVGKTQQLSMGLADRDSRGWLRTAANGEVAVVQFQLLFLLCEYLRNLYQRRRRSHRIEHLLIDDIPLGSYPAGITSFSDANLPAIPEHQQS